MRSSGPLVRVAERLRESVGCGGGNVGGRSFGGSGFQSATHSWACARATLCRDSPHPRARRVLASNDALDVTHRRVSPPDRVPAHCARRLSRASAPSAPPHRSHFRALGNARSGASGAAVCAHCARRGLVLLCSRAGCETLRRPTGRCSSAGWVQRVSCSADQREKDGRCSEQARFSHVAYRSFATCHSVHCGDGRMKR